ncbi:DUF4230 domain-containing protein [Luteolibacter flavescens]|uniref:DUF4230 domain-containing protein n=1 Tax=Luteolibacter flavescens TaxID=1859460 RepID=A0ABT3FM96_9BACT|nr:DUF4230 domain-containing protein [Luteolibacter flavescens]MCW1884314.1 DUF4230 domain-containing protein [Luteolibacter flavescens]
MSAHHPELWKTLRWIALLATVVVLAWFGIRTFERGVGGTVSGLEKVLGAITNSDTRVVEGRAEIVSQSEITELALVELKMSATRSFENETFILKYFSGGKKRLIVRGEYRVTAGYKLQPGVSLRMDGNTPVAQFPAPQILSVELIDFQPLNEESGWWNSITPDDRAQLLRDLRLQMRSEAQRSGVLEIVESTMRTRLKDLLGTGDVKVERAEKK